MPQLQGSMIPQIKKGTHKNCTDRQFMTKGYQQVDDPDLIHDYELHLPVLNEWPGKQHCDISSGTAICYFSRSNGHIFQGTSIVFLRSINVSKYKGTPLNCQCMFLYRPCSFQSSYQRSEASDFRMQDTLNIIGPKEYVIRIDATDFQPLYLKH